MAREKFAKQIVDEGGKTVGYVNASGQFKSKERLYNEAEAGHRADLVPYLYKGEKFVKTPPDASAKNNLGGLPKERR